jgi:hypothetical protein
MQGFIVKEKRNDKVVELRPLYIPENYVPEIFQREADFVI